MRGVKRQIELGHGRQIKLDHPEGSVRSRRCPWPFHCCALGGGGQDAGGAPEEAAATLLAKPVASPRIVTPRVRGKRVRLVPECRALRSIPARAGETGSTGVRRGYRRVHPRACGGNIDGSYSACQNTGPSPRVRGKPAGLLEPRGQLRSIPARAGETRTGRCRSGCPWVHPRACGGNRECQDLPGLLTGPSPRVRGKPGVSRPARALDGSIPARAGETPGARIGRGR